MPDLAKPNNAHVEERLRSEKIVWLSSVRPESRPHLVPVWFYWDGSYIWIFSQPKNQKIRNLRANPNVMLALEAADEGGDVVLFEGRAELLNEPASQLNLPGYIEKYGNDIKDMGMTPESMTAGYSQPIRITPTKFISWS